MGKTMYDEPLIDDEVLKLLGIKNHPLAGKKIGDATRDEVREAADLHERAAKALKRAKK
jgi:AAA+ superfamily predicted ATPase